MEQDFEKFVKERKQLRRDVLKFAIFFMLVGAFFIFIDWMIMGSFHSIEYSGLWWSSTAFGDKSAFNLQIGHDDDYAGKVALPKGMGMSVRCIMY